MIFFPIIYEDELLYSCISRYHIRSGNLTYRETLQDIFGDKNISPGIYMQSNIKHFIDNLPLRCIYSEKDLVYNNTLYLYYTAFMDELFSNKVYNSMVYTDNSHVYAECGIAARGTMSHEYLKFCPMCLNEDINNYGEAYWHKTHQVPDYLICTKHKVLLQESTVEISRYNKYELIEANLENCIIKENNINYTSKTMEALYRLSINIEIILKNNLDKKDNIWFKENYKNYLKVLNYSSLKGVIDQSKSSEDFQKYYGKEFLDILGLNIDNNKRNWLKKLLSYTEHSNSTIKHLLLIDFLGINLNDLFNRIYLYEPFGKGLWPCLNKEEEHYCQNVIEDLDVGYDYKTKCIVGIFSCRCGFKYKIRYQKHLTGNKDSQKKLYDLIIKKDFDNIIKSLHKEISIYDECLGKVDLILYEKSASIEHRKKLDELKEETRKKHRKIWINQMKKYPNKNKSELVKKCVSTGSWLYKFDKEWLRNNSPDRKKSIDYSKNKIDWNKKDDEILKKAEKLVKNLYEEDKDLKRVTKSKVLKICGIKDLSLKNLNKMPKTKKFLDDNIETYQDFRIRKIKWKIKDLFNEDEKITTTKLLSGMKISRDEKEELKFIIETELDRCRKNI